MTHEVKNIFRHAKKEQGHHTYGVFPCPENWSVTCYNNPCNHALDSGQFKQHCRQRAAGGGRAGHTDLNGELARAIEETVSGATYGSPMTVLKWTPPSLRKICRILEERYCLKSSHSTVKKGLKKLATTARQIKRWSRWAFRVMLQ